MNYTELVNELLSGDVTHLESKAATAIKALQARCGKAFEEGRDFQAQVESQLRRERDALQARVTSLEAERDRNLLSITDGKNIINRLHAEHSDELVRMNAVHGANAKLFLEDLTRTEAERDVALARLEALEKQAPVAYYNEGIEYHTRGKINFHKEPTVNLETRWWTEDKSLYASPVPAKTLTDAEIDALMSENEALQLRGQELAGEVEAQLKQAVRDALETAAKLIEGTEMSGLQSDPKMQLFIAQLLSCYVTAIRKLKERL